MFENSVKQFVCNAVFLINDHLHGSAVNEHPSMGPDELEQSTVLMLVKLIRQPRKFGQTLWFGICNCLSVIGSNDSIDLQLAWSTQMPLIFFNFFCRPDGQSFLMII